VKSNATRLWLVLILVLTGASGALAQKVELSPFATLPFGGKFETDARGDFPNLDVDDGSGYGLGLGFSLSRSFQLEVFWSHQRSDLVADGGFFGGGFPLSELDIDYYHAGILYQWGGGQFRPFIAGSLGVTEFGPADPFLDTETRFSVGVGAGAKIFFNQNLGLRFEGRAFSTVIDAGNDSCRRGSCFYDDGTYFFQAELRGGLIFAF